MNSYTDSQIHIIPNTQPGWMVVQPIHGEHEVDGIEEVPVVAWMTRSICTGPEDCHEFNALSAIPIIPDDIFGDYALRMPDGRFLTPGHGLIQDESGIIRHFQSKVDMRKRIAAGRQA